MSRHSQYWAPPLGQSQSPEGAIAQSGASDHERSHSHRNENRKGGQEDETSLPPILARHRGGCETNSVGRRNNAAPTGLLVTCRARMIVMRDVSWTGCCGITSKHRIPPEEKARTAQLQRRPAPEASGQPGLRTPETTPMSRPEGESTLVCCVC